MWSKCPLWVISRARRDGDAMHWLMTRDTPRGGLWITGICLNDCNNDNGPIFSIRLITVAASVLQDVIIASLVRLLHGLRWKSNSNCVLSWLSNKSSKFYKISSFLNKIMLKKFAEFVFLCGHSVVSLTIMQITQRLVSTELSAPDSLLLL